MASIQTSVLLLVFNRPDLTRKLIQSLERVKPVKLFVVADGPRNHSPTDKKRCLEVRELFDNLTWNCEIHRNFRNENLGCAKSVSEGINWFFEHNDTGIILEDDCIPDPSFFTFCETLLLKYASNENIYHISGNNFQFGKQRGDGDYYFSIFNHLWGWATWKRAWSKFDFDIEMKDVENMKPFVRSEKIHKYFAKQFQNTIDGRMDSWGFRWTFACWKNSGLSILPNKNLVSNIGFGEDSTHTSQLDSPQNNLTSYSISGSLSHPKDIKINRRADLYSFRKIFQPSKTPRYYIDALKRRLIN